MLTYPKTDEERNLAYEQYQRQAALFFTMVQERPETEYTIRRLPPCPHCNAPSPPEEEMAVMSTCMGVIGVDLDKYPEQDPNQKWRSVKCPQCQKNYCIESEHANVWVTVAIEHAERSDIHNYAPNARLVVRGLPSKSGSYIYHCGLCEGGLVRRQYLKKDSDEPLHKPGEPCCLSYDPKRGGAQYRASWLCDRCGARIITPNFEYWIVRALPLNGTPEERANRLAMNEAIEKAG